MTDQVNEALRALAERAVPFLRDEANKYEDDGSNEPLELAREIEAFIAAHPSRGVVDEAMVRAALNAQPFADSRNSSVRVWQLFINELDAEAIIRAALQAAALPAVPDVLSATERQAVEELIASADHDAGDVFDSPPDQDADEDAYWAYHRYHALTKLLSATPAHDQPEGYDYD